MANTDVNGNPIVIPNVVQTSSLATPPTPINVTQPAVDTNSLINDSNASAAYTSSALAEAQRQAEQQAQAQRDQVASANTDIGRLSSSLNAAGTNLANSTVNNVYNETGVNDKLAILNKLNAESLGLTYNNTTIPLALQNQAAGTGRTDRGNAPLETKQLRDNAIQLASNAYQSAIAKNDYETAKSKADQIIAYKYDTILADINAKKTNLENIKANLTVAEKKVADATARALDKQKADAERKMADEKAVSDLIIQASQVAPPDVLKKAKDLQAKGATPTEVAMSLGQYGGDYLKNQTYRSQLETDKAQRANFYSQIAERNAKAIKENNLANFVTPPVVNAQTGAIDPKSMVASVIKSTGAKLKGGQAALDVLSSVQALADRNAKGEFSGVGLGSGLVPERFKNQKEISNRQDIEAIGLKVQQWASGASLTAEQTKMVEKFTPQGNDSDNAVKTKINGLVNFMMGQISSDLVGQGINFAPSPIDMFSGIKSVDNKTLLNSIPSATTDTTKLVDNKSFFDR